MLYENKKVFLILPLLNLFFQNNSFDLYQKLFQSSYYQFFYLTRRQCLKTYYIWIIFFSIPYYFQKRYCYILPLKLIF